MTKRRQKYPQQLPDHSLWFRHKLAPKTYGQEFYINAINENDIVLCQGPAGTGKTWIVTRLALEALNSNDVSKIVVTKPILEAGDEEIGFLPGEVDDKIAPHFQSVIDCFEDHIGPAKTKQLIDDGKIEFLPTAYCRGRSILNAFILVDEAQNLTRKGIRLILTRIAEGSIMVLNGDSDQVDLKNPDNSGFSWAVDRLSGKNSRIGIVKLDKSDVQRHPLITSIIENLY